MQHLCDTCSHPDPRDHGFQWVMQGVCADCPACELDREPMPTPDELRAADDSARDDANNHRHAYDPDCCPADAPRR